MSKFLFDNGQLKIEIDGQLIDLEELEMVYRKFFETEEAVEEKELMKTVGGESYPAKAFLVVDDPKAVGSWHLPVLDAEGKPDHNRMGAAWAALHGGYMGNKYEGPNKEEAIKKLTDLYKMEGMEVPMKEMWQTMGDYTEEVARSFATQQANSDAFAYFEDLVTDHPVLGNAVIVETRGKEFSVPYTEADGVFTFAPREEWVEVYETYIPKTYMLGTRLSQSAEVSESSEIAECDSAVIDFDELAEASGSEVMRIRTRLIRPGFGNQRDNHYYSEEMLRRDAEKFVGCKMYESDHRDAEKSNRTWVSTVGPIVSWDNGPISEVIVHDPNFAERARNLKKAGLLDKLECSILANGAVGPLEEIQGRKGRKVLSITETRAVDWVTRAGAGGGAVGLSESEPDEREPIVPEPVEEVFLSETEVNNVINPTNLPQQAKDRLRRGTYRTTEEVKCAVTQEIDYIKSVSGSGKPVSSGSAVRESAHVETLAEREKRIGSVNQKYFGGK